MHRLNKTLSVLRSYPWLLVLNLGPISKRIGYVYLEHHCHYAEGAVTYDVPGYRLSYTGDKEFLTTAKAEVIRWPS